LINIPGHCAIYRNELADQKAKEEAKKIVTGRTEAPQLISATDAHKIASEIEKKIMTMQVEKILEDILEYIPSVGTKILWSNKHDIGTPTAEFCYTTQC